MKAKSQKRPTTMHQPASKKEKVNLLTRYKYYEVVNIINIMKATFLSFNLEDKLNISCRKYTIVYFRASNENSPLFLIL